MTEGEKAEIEAIWRLSGMEAVERRIGGYSIRVQWVVATGGRDAKRYVFLVEANGDQCEGAYVDGERCPRRATRVEVVEDGADFAAAGFCAQCETGSRARWFAEDR